MFHGVFGAFSGAPNHIQSLENGIRSQETDSVADSVHVGEIGVFAHLWVSPVSFSGHVCCEQDAHLFFRTQTKSHFQTEQNHDFANTLSHRLT